MLKKIRFEKRSSYADKIISLKMFDAKGSYHKNKDNVFNFDDEEKNFAYDKEQGFLADGNFTEVERGLIHPVLHKTLLSETDEDKKEGGKSILYPNNDIELAVSNYNDSYYQNLEDRVFLLDVNEIHDYVWENREILGEKYKNAFCSYAI